MTDTLAEARPNFPTRATRRPNWAHALRVDPVRPVLILFHGDAGTGPGERLVAGVRVADAVEPARARGSLAGAGPREDGAPRPAVAKPGRSHRPCRRVREEGPEVDSGASPAASWIMRWTLEGAAVTVRRLLQHHATAPPRELAL